MNIEDFYFSKKKEYRFSQDHISELVGKRVTVFQLESLGCTHTPGSQYVTNYSNGKPIGRVWKCRDLGAVVSELRAGRVGSLGQHLALSTRPVGA